MLHGTDTGQAAQLTLSPGCALATALHIDGDELDDASWGFDPNHTDVLTLDTTVFEAGTASHEIVAIAGETVLATGTFLIDNAPPMLNVVAPSPAAKVSGLTQVLVDAVPPHVGVSDIASLRTSIEGRVLTSAPASVDESSGTAHFAVDVDMTGLANGPHDLDLVVTRMDGVSAETGVTVEIANPTTSFSESIAPTTTLSYGGTAVITGRLIDSSNTDRAPLGGREVKLYTIPKGSYVAKLVTTTTTDPTGLVTVKVSNARIGGKFQLVFAPEVRSEEHPSGYAGSTSPWRVLTVGSSTKLEIGTRSVGLGKAFSAKVTTSAVSRDGNGKQQNVPIQIQVQSGSAWKTVATVSTTATTNTMRWTMPAKGTYKVRASRGADVGLSASTSGVITITVT